MSSDEDVEFLSEKKAENDESVVTIESSDESENEDIPDGAECLKRCREFASVTETDNALAMFYLQENKWDLQLSIEAYLSATNHSSKKVAAIFNTEKLDKDEEQANKKFKQDEHDNQRRDLRESNQQQDNQHFKVMSWNIDGIDEAALEARAEGVVKKILGEKPEIVLLQEVVPVNERILRKGLDNLYDFHSGNSHENSDYIDFKCYYSIILSKKNSFKLLNKDLISFENSVMDRKLLKVILNYDGKINMCLMTSHLESTADYGNQRIVQLKRAFKEMLDIDEQTLVIFGGDLNLRDSELNSIGGLPKGIHDIWQSTGSRKECTWTWDMTRNTNLRWQGKFKPRCRFDRMYFKANKLPISEANENYTLMPVYFELEGLEKLKSCARFCSDHWAIQSYFELKLNSI